MEDGYNQHLREIRGTETRIWKPQRESMALGIIEAFLKSDMEMAEVNLDVLPLPESKGEPKVKSSKQDSFASSFYAWKRKSATQAKLAKLGIDILLIRRENKVALKKTKRKK